MRVMKKGKREGDIHENKPIVARLKPPPVGSVASLLHKLSRSLSPQNSPLLLHNPKLAPSPFAFSFRYFSSPTLRTRYTSAFPSLLPPFAIFLLFPLLFVSLPIDDRCCTCLTVIPQVPLSSAGANPEAPAISQRPLLNNSSYKSLPPLLASDPTSCDFFVASSPPPGRLSLATFSTSRRCRLKTKTSLPGNGQTPPRARAGKRAGISMRI